MDQSQEQALLLLLHCNKMSLEYFNTVCMFGSEINMQLVQTQLVESEEVKRYNMRFRLHDQIGRNLRLFVDDDESCIDNLRMDRNCFHKLVDLLKTRGGLTDGTYVSVKEQVGIFLSIIAHNKKCRIIHFDFMRSTETISKYFHKVLNAILSLSSEFLVNQTPVGPGNAPEKWQHFQGCLGALDGTHVRVLVPKDRQLPYRGRKGVVTMNVLAACDWNMNFTYVLSGWEGSASDSRVLANALARPNGLRVPDGQYYLVDNGYTHGAGFMTPYSQTRYHLKAWGVGREAPQDPHEYFNMAHSRARNVIERAFGLLKKRWVTLDEQGKYPVEVQGKVILACCLLQNFIRRNMDRDPLEDAILEEDEDEPIEDEVPGDYVQVLERSDEWDDFREEMAIEMYEEWYFRRGGQI